MRHLHRQQCNSLLRNSSQLQSSSLLRSSNLLPSSDQLTALRTVAAGPVPLTGATNCSPAREGTYQSTSAAANGSVSSSTQYSCGQPCKRCTVTPRHCHQRLPTLAVMRTTRATVAWRNGTATTPGITT